MRSQYDRRDECRGGREEVDSRTDLWRSRSWWNISLEKVWRKSRVGENADEFMKGWMSRNRGMTGVSGARWEVFDPLLLGEEGVAMITEVFEVDDTHELTLAMTEFGILCMPESRRCPTSGFPRRVTRATKVKALLSVLGAAESAIRYRLSQ